MRWREIERKTERNRKRDGEREIERDEEMERDRDGERKGERDSGSILCCVQIHEPVCKIVLLFLKLYMKRWK